MLSFAIFLRRRCSRRPTRRGVPHTRSLQQMNAPNIKQRAGGLRHQTRGDNRPDQRTQRVRFRHQQNHLRRIPLPYPSHFSSETRLSLSTLCCCAARCASFASTPSDSRLLHRLPRSRRLCLRCARLQTDQPHSFNAARGRRTREHQCVTYALLAVFFVLAIRENCTAHSSGSPHACGRDLRPIFPCLLRLPLSLSPSLPCPLAILCPRV